MLFSPRDEGSRLAAGEQDAQHQARPSASTVAPATLAPRGRFLTLTGRPFLPVAGNPSRGGSGITTPT